MATTAAILDIMVRANTSTASASLNRLNTNLRGSTKTAQMATKQTDSLNKSTTRLGPTLRSVAKYAVGLGAAYVGLQAAKDAVEATTDLAKVTLTLKKGFGLSIKTGSELGAVLKARGADATSVGMAFNTLSKQIVAAKGGSATAAKSFKELGISQKELKKTSPDKLLFSIADGLDKAGRGADRQAAAATLFGRGWKTVVPALRDGSKSMKEQLDLANKYGASFGGKSVKSIHDLINTQRELKIAQLGLQVQFTEKIAPALIKVGLATADLIKWIEGAVHWTSTAAKNFAHWISTTGTLAETLKGIIKILIDFAKFEYKVGAAAVSAAKWIGGAFGDVIGAGKDVVSWFKNAWGDLKGIITHPFSAAVSVVTGFINKIIDVINVIPGVNIGHVGGGGGGFPSSVGKSKAQGKGPGPHRGVQRGGFMVGGVGSGDTVPAMLEPGEFVLNREAVQAIGVQNLQKTNKQFPRFQIGGEVQRLAFGGSVAKKITGSAGDIVGKLPSASSLPQWMQGLGDYLLSKAKDFAVSKAKSAVGGVLGGTMIDQQTGQAKVVAVGRLLQQHGFLVSENPAFGGVHPVHAAGSYHYQGRAIDVNWPNAAKEPAHLRPLYNSLAKTHPTELFYQNRGIPGPVPNHYDHLHLAYQRGGSVRLARGGGVPPPRHGAHWIHGGSHWSVDEAATLLWQAGLSPSVAGQLARVVPGESGGNPKAHNPSGATGLFQILGAMVPGNLYDPRINALNAVAKYRSQGFGAWEAGRSGPAGRILYDAVGKARGKAATKTKRKKGKKGGGGSPDTTSIADAITEGYAQYLEDYAARAGVINELVGGQNTLALQGFAQAGAQNSLLGIAAPHGPSLAPMLSTTPSLAEGFSALSGIAAGVYGPRSAPQHHTHVHVHVKDKRLKDFIDIQVEKGIKKKAKRAARPLPGARR